MPRACCLLLLAVISTAHLSVCGAAAVPSDRGVPPAVPPPEEADSAPPEADWTYERQDLWPRLFAACGGPRQSPTRLDDELLQLGGGPELSFAPGLAEGRVKAKNTGHTLKLELSTEREADSCNEVDVGVCDSGDAKPAPVVTLSAHSSPLAGSYRLEQLHFHWGDSQGTPGSEHQLDGELSDAEAHFVFFNSRYGSFSAALENPDGLAVVGILLDGSETGKQEPGRLVWPALGLRGRLWELAEVNSELTVLTDLTPLRPVLRQAVGRAFSYRGSLTTPPCSPVVRWLVSATRVTIDQGFLEELRSTLHRDEAGRLLLQNNRRRLQQRRDRIVLEHVKLNRRNDGY